METGLKNLLVRDSRLCLVQAVTNFIVHHIHPGYLYKHRILNIIPDLLN